jgi:hypothetical protein
VRGAIGAVVLPTPAGWPTASLARLLRGARLPFIVAVNRFNGVLTHVVDDVATRSLNPNVPIVTCDARERVHQTDADRARRHAMRLPRAATARILIIRSRDAPQIR